MRSKEKYISVYNIILFILVVSPIYQDSPLSKYLGAAGYSLLMPLSLIFLCIYIALEGKIYKNKYIHCLTNLGIWIFVVSIVAIFIWFILEKSISYIGENLVVKMIKVFLQYMSYVAYVYLLVGCLKKCGINVALKYAFYALIFMTIICYIELIQIPYAFQNLHNAAIFPYWRVRLLTLESSMTSLLIYNYIALAMIYAVLSKSKIKAIVVVLSGLYLFFNTGSKTLMISVVITFVVFFIINLKKISIKKMIIMGFSIILACGLLYGILPRFIESIAADVTQYTSVATRGYTILIGILLGLLFPFGVGGSVYMGVLQWALKKYIYIFDKLPIKLNTKEIMEIANSSTDNAVVIKSGLLQYNLYWGIIGTIIFIRNAVSLVRDVKTREHKYSDIIIAVFITNILLILLSNNFCFEFWLLYSIMIYLTLGE